MKRLLLLVPMLLAAPVSAQVDPAIHKLCLDAKDYSGCVQTQLSLSKKAKSEPTPIATSEPSELTPWQVHLNKNPSLKAWVEANPTLADKKREEWEGGSKNRNVKFGSGHMVITENEKTKAEIDECIRIGGNWDFEIKDSSGNVKVERGCTAKTYDAASSSSSDQSNQCPAGKRQYQRTFLFGLIKGQKLCLSDYEAESLRAQQQRDIQNNVRNSMPKFVNCTSHAFGNYVSTSCY